MGRFFLSENPELFYYEQLMQEIPGFEKRNRKKRRCDVKACEHEKSKKYLSNIKIIVPEYFDGFVDLKQFFLNRDHMTRFCELNKGAKGPRMRLSNRYAAAIYFLSADECLWELCKCKVGEFGIFFKDIKPKGLDLNAYFLFMAAKSVYYGKMLINKDEIEDKELISDDMKRVLSNGLYVLEHGNTIIREVIR